MFVIMNRSFSNRVFKANTPEQTFELEATCWLQSPTVLGQNRLEMKCTMQQENGINKSNTSLYCYCVRLFDECHSKLPAFGGIGRGKLFWSCVFFNTIFCVNVCVCLSPTCSSFDVEMSTGCHSLRCAAQETYVSKSNSIIACTFHHQVFFF